MRSLPERQARLGERAEELFRLELDGARKRGEIEFFCRPEWIVVPNVGAPYLCEVKGQEMFEAPPFDGHGLPYYQADRYQQLFARLGLRTRFIVYDPSGFRYSAWLHELEGRGSEYVFETKGERHRRIYEIGGFKVKPLQHRIAA